MKASSNITKLIFLLLILTTLAYLNQSFSYPSTSNTMELTLAEGGDQKAQFPGGKEAMNKWIKENLQYPKKDLKYGISHIEFTVKKNGTCSDFVIKKSLTESCDYAAVDCLSKMPKWEPAMKDGKKVNSTVTIPVRFVRESEETETESAPTNG